VTVRSCTCGAARRTEAGFTLIAGVVGHFRDCASLLPDPDTCEHANGVKRDGEVYCGRCGKGLSVGARDWFKDNMAPGYAEAQAVLRRKREGEIATVRLREDSYDIAGIHLDYGITDLSNDELTALIDCCTREQNHRAVSDSPKIETRLILHRANGKRITLRIYDVAPARVRGVPTVEATVAPYHEVLLRDWLASEAQPAPA